MRRELQLKTAARRPGPSNQTRWRPIALPRDSWSSPRTTPRGQSRGRNERCTTSRATMSGLWGAATCGFGHYRGTRRRSFFLLMSQFSFFPDLPGRRENGAYIIATLPLSNDGINYASRVETGARVHAFLCWDSVNAREKIKT